MQWECGRDRKIENRVEKVPTHVAHEWGARTWQLVTANYFASRFRVEVIGETLF
jgi:hypothetical protein